MSGKYCISGTHHFTCILCPTPFQLWKPKINFRRKGDRPHSHMYWGQGSFSYMDGCCHKKKKDEINKWPLLVNYCSDLGTKSVTGLWVAGNIIRLHVTSQVHHLIRCTIFNVNQSLNNNNLGLWHKLWFSTNPKHCDSQWRVVMVHWLKQWC